MDPNENAESSRTWSNLDNEEDIEFMIAAYEYQQRLEQEEANPQTQVPRTHIYRERKLAEQRLINDYFVNGCKYTPRNFRRRFRMRQNYF